MDSRLSMIYSRRSVRRFTGAPLPDETLAELLQAAMAAPSAKNGQPWHFVVITDEHVRHAIAANHPYAPFAKTAGVVVVVCGDSTFELVQHDLAAATQNLLLAATGLGLGACWCGMTEERQPAIRSLLGIPDRVAVCSLVCLGYPAEEHPARTNYMPERIHRNHWRE